ncbi:Gx transporter family protein [Anaerovoracaceae bacterium SGI.195]
MRTSASNLTMSAMLACLALIFSYVEFLIPISLGIPGVKLGLANLVIIIALYGLDWKYALTINVVRICLSGLLFSGVFGIMYSMGGGIISFIVMIGLIKSRKFSIVGVSMAGGVFHNLGQILVAAQLISNLKIFYYFPVLLFSGMGTGIVIGFIAYYLGAKIPRQLFPNLRNRVLS